MNRLQIYQKRMFITTSAVIVLTSPPAAALANGSSFVFPESPKYSTMIAKESATSANKTPGVTGQPSSIIPRGQANSSSNDSKQVPQQDELAADHQDTIVVTGTHIRGVDTSVGSQLIQIGREDIKASGFTTTRDIFEKLPQNFGGGATGERQSNPESTLNTGFGSTVNLRGLGSVATLVLVNGKRLPAGGFSNSAVDITTIPVTAIERVEILPDGASAVYGSDAVAGVVNFLLRSDYNGFESQFRYGTAPHADYNEIQFSQIAGATWQSGSGIITYEFTGRDRLRRTDIKFAETSDLRSKGGSDLRLIYSNPSNIIDQLTMEVLYAIPAGQDGRNISINNLLPPERANKFDPAKFQDIYPRQDQHSVFGHVSQSITDNTTIYFDSWYSHRSFSYRQQPNTRLLVVPNTNPYYIDINGDGSPIFVAYSFHRDHESQTYDGYSEQYAITSTLRQDIFKVWQGEIWLSHVKSKESTDYNNTILSSALNNALATDDINRAFNPFSDGKGTPDSVINEIFSRKAWLRVNSRINQAQLLFNGPLFYLGEGQLKAAFGADIREETFKQNNSGEQREVKRDVEALFGEIFIPLLNGTSDNAVVDRLEISASIRYERFKDKSRLPIREERSAQSSTNPRVGILFSPMPELIIRGSYGTSFRAPPLFTLSEEVFIAALPLPDPSSPTGEAYSLVLSGARPDLDNETATSWTAGIEIRPFQNDTIINVSAFRVKFKNQVVGPDIERALWDPAYASIIIRNPTLQDLAAACSLARPDRQAVGPADCNTPGVVQAIIDGRSTNFSRTKVDGIDIAVNHQIGTNNIGQIVFGVNGTFLTKYDVGLAPGAKPIRLLDTAGNPVDFRARGSVTWQPNDNISSIVFLNYVDRYSDAMRNRKISSHTTFDLSIAYSIDGNVFASLLRNVSVQLNIQNIFNNNPPFYEDASSRIAYDAANFDAYGRLISVTITKKW